MPFLGTAINFFGVLLFGTLGAFAKRGMPKHISDSIMAAMAVCVIYIGVDGMLEAAPAVPEGSFLSSGLVKVLIMILSMGIGALIGELIDFDKLLSRLGDAFENRINKLIYKSDGEIPRGNFARGFVSCSMLFCIGAMAVNGSLRDAFGDPSILLAKTVIDSISCFIMATTLGIGCAFSAFMILFYQGTLTVLGYFLSSVIPAATVTYMSVTGSLIIIIIGMNMLGITRVKTANLVPAIFMPLALAPLFSPILRF